MSRLLYYFAVISLSSRPGVNKKMTYHKMKIQVTLLKVVVKADC